MVGKVLWLEDQKGLQCSVQEQGGEEEFFGVEEMQGRKSEKEAVERITKKIGRPS